MQGVFLENSWSPTILARRLPEERLPEGAFKTGVGNLFGWESHEHHIFFNVIPWEPYNMFDY